MEKVSANYCVAMPVPKFLQLSGLDYLGVVLPALKQAGAESVEYDGHFGPNVFFTATQAAAPVVLKALNKLLSRRPATGAHSKGIATKQGEGSDAE